MIFDFYHKFDEIYPLNKDVLLLPDREMLGYFWEFEDYMIQGEKGNGNIIKGFLINNSEDLFYFRSLFNRAFMMTVINSVVRLPGDSFEDFSPRSSDDEYLEDHNKKVVKNITAEFRSRIDKMESFFELLCCHLKEGAMWISLEGRENIPLDMYIKEFWGPSIKIEKFPNIFSILNRKDVWEEADRTGPLDFKEEMAWQEFSFTHPNLVKYIDEEIRVQADVNYIANAQDFGLI
jgi:hypothetical protein